MKLTCRMRVERKWYWRVGRFEIQVGRLSRSIAGLVIAGVLLAVKLGGYLQ